MVSDYDFKVLGYSQSSEKKSEKGKGFVLNQDFEDIHPTYKPVLFADFKRFYIREVLPLKIIRLDELYAATDETGFAILGRYDSKVATPSTSYPARYIRNATT